MNENKSENDPIFNPFSFADKELPANNTLDKKEATDRLIRNYVIWSMGAGLIPLPLLDIAAVTALQLDLIKKIADLYGHSFQESQARAWVSALAGSASARLAADFIKLIPGVGTVLGGVTQSVLAGATTYALGKAFEKHFDTGGNFLDFDPMKMKVFFKEQYEKGKNYAQKLWDERKPGNPAKPIIPVDDIQTIMLNKLKELKTLYDTGVLDLAEYEALKSKIIDEFISK